MKYLYAITRAGVEVPAMAALAGAPLETIRYADVQVVCSDLGPVNLDVPDASCLWAHEGVVEAVGAACDAVLPMRFGSTVRDRPRAVALLAGRHDEFVWGLERVRGTVEIGVRVVSLDGAHRPVSPVSRVNGKEVTVDKAPGRARGRALNAERYREGSAYLRGRAAEQGQVDELADRVHTPLAQIARAARRATFVVPPTVLAASYLAPRDGLDEFRQHVAAISASSPDLTLVCTGPWPPYSFTGDVGTWPLGSVAS